MEGMLRDTDPERLGWCILRGGIFVGPGTGQDDLIARVRAGRVVVPGDGGSIRALLEGMQHLLGWEPRHSIWPA